MEDIMTGKEIRALREGMKLGRTAFCALIDTPIETERKWETGHRVPKAMHGCTTHTERLIGPTMVDLWMQ